MTNILSLPKEPRILADSINWTGFRLTSFLFALPTCLLAELRTHRLLKWSDTGLNLNIDYSHDLDFSVNANSDRAIPITKKIESVEKFPYIPIPTLANKGMSGIEEVDPIKANELKNAYWYAMESAVKQAKHLEYLGGSKQLVNRLLMPFSWSFVVVTGDNIAWESFFALRTVSGVEPNFRFIANKLKEMYNLSQPEYLQDGEWHISFKEEIAELELIENRKLSLNEKLIVSGSCNARISFDVYRQEKFTKHYDRYFKCVDSNHISITEHQAQVPYSSKYYGMEFRSNVNGWVLTRKLIEQNLIDLREVV